MKACGIVAEYNPFHNGHLYQINQLRAQGFTHIVAVMSGNFVQRGEPSLFDKHIRASAALQCGVDLVIELPFGYSFSSAQQFCAAAVETLTKLNCINALAFGSESGSLDILTATANALADSRIDALIREQLQTGITYAAARENAVRRLYPNELADTLKDPNDILAIGYIEALRALESDIQPIVIKRVGSAHDGIGAEYGSISSAAHIRQLITACGDWQSLVPPAAAAVYKSAIESGRAPVLLQNAERMVLSRLRECTRADFDALSDCAEGLGGRLYNAAQNAGAIEQLYSLAKTKRYTHARIRRLFLSAALGCHKPLKPVYIRVLGMNNKGAQLLGSTTLPCVSGYSQACSAGESAQQYYLAVSSSTDFYTMLMPDLQPCGFEMTQSIVKI